MGPSVSTVPCCSKRQTIRWPSLVLRASTPHAATGRRRLPSCSLWLPRLPLPEFLAALGDLYAGMGDARKAQEQYDLVHVIQQLNAGAGMNVDLELATFDVLHGGNVQSALTAAQAAYKERPTIYAADTLAWALHRSGDDQAAWRYSQEALRLGTRDAMLHAHAAAIAASLGDAAAAEQQRAEVEKINPHYSPWK